MTRETVAIHDGELEKKVYDLIQEKIIKQFIDLILLTAFKDRIMGGYDAVVFIKEKYELSVSPGTVYQRLYSMERDGLLTAIPTDDKRTYKLSHLGKGTIDVLSNPKGKVMQFFLLLLKGLSETQCTRE